MNSDRVISPATAETSEEDLERAVQERMAQLARMAVVEREERRIEEAADRQATAIERKFKGIAGS